MKKRNVVLLGMVVLGMSCSKRAGSSSVDHRAFIWQRLWSSDLDSSIAQTQTLFSAYHVLAVQIDSVGKSINTKIDTDYLQKNPVPMVAVIRISDRCDSSVWNVLPSIVTYLKAPHFPKWKGVEIDYDCPTSKLGVYAEKLRTFKKRLPDSWSLTITALPTWIGSSSLGPLTDIVDTLALQVHSVRDPQSGIFNSEHALRWTTQFSKKCRSPFLIALPCYDSRIYLDNTKTVIGVENETSRSDLHGLTPVQLYTNAEDVTAFIDSVSDKTPRNFAGFIWFRLPVKSDNQCWTVAKLQTVIEKKSSTQRNIQ